MEKVGQRREKAGKKERKRKISKANERRKKKITTMLPEKRVRIMC